MRMPAVGRGAWIPLYSARGGNRSLGQQPRGELAPTLSLTRAGHAPLPPHANLAEVRLVHASVLNHFNQERSLSSRDIIKCNRAAALAEWRGLCAE